MTEYFVIITLYYLYCKNYCSEQELKCIIRNPLYV